MAKMHRIKIPIFCLVYAVIILLGLGLFLCLGFSEFLHGFIKIFLLK